jgi:hypothetical protein
MSAERATTLFILVWSCMVIIPGPSTVRPAAVR